MVTALVIPAAGPPRIECITAEPATLQHLVGGNIQGVTRAGWHAYLHAEGKLLRLPVNPLATELLYAESDVRDPVVGDVVILGNGPDGCEASAPSQLARRVLGLPNTRRRVTPIDILAAMPHVWGTHPTESLVMIGLYDGRVVASTTAALRDLHHPFVLERAIHELLRSGTTEAIVAVIVGAADPQPIPHQQLADQIRATLAQHRVDTAQAIWSTRLEAGASWLNYDTGTGGTIPAQSSNTDLVRWRLLDGTLALPGGRELVAGITTHNPVGADAASVAAAAGAAQDLIAALGRAAAGPSDPAVFRPAALANVLCDLPARDLAIAHTAASTAAARHLWTLLLRIAGLGHRGPAAALLALAAYLDGDTRLARAALEVVHHDGDTSTSLAVYLGMAMDEGLAPRRIRAELLRALDGEDPATRHSLGD